MSTSEEESMYLDEFRERELEEAQPDPEELLLDVPDPYINPAHNFKNYESGLDLGIIKNFLERGEEKTLDQCIQFLNGFCVQVMSSSTCSMSYQVLVAQEDKSVVWKPWTKAYLLDQIRGFSLWEERYNEKTKKTTRKEIKVGEEWVKSLERKWVKVMKYDPSMAGGTHGNEVLNTFTGFPYNGIYNIGIFSVHHLGAQDVIEVIVHHLREVLCRGNKQIYTFVKKWMRMVRQHPEFRPEVVLVFIGEEGIGKSQFFRYFAKVFGRNAVYLAEPRSLLAKFAGDQLDDRVLVCCDEADFNDKEFGPRLKNLVTSEERHHEKKNQHAKQIKNYLNGIFTTNSRNCLPVSSDGHNRRYFPVTVSSEHKNDQKYFDRLEEMLDNEHGQIIFDAWLRKKKVPAERMHPPVTEELNNMKIIRQSDLQNWWLQVLDDRRHVSVSSLDQTMPYELDHVYKDWVLFPVNLGALHQMYTIHIRNKTNRRNDFILSLKEILPPSAHIDMADANNARFPTLLECKDFAHKKLGIKGGDKFIGSEKNERKRKRYDIRNHFPSRSSRPACD